MLTASGESRCTPGVYAAGLVLVFGGAVAVSSAVVADAVVSAWTDRAGPVVELQSAGRVVAIVGDGVDAAAALAHADLGAMGTGTDAAIEAADNALMRGDPRSIADAIQQSVKALRAIRINQFWAFAYNVAAVPLAGLGLVDPILAGAAMAFSSVVVGGNSLRLRSLGRHANTGSDTGSDTDEYVART